MDGLEVDPVYPSSVAKSKLNIAAKIGWLALEESGQVV
jgi:hypothetical protein